LVLFRGSFSRDTVAIRESSEMCLLEGQGIVCQKNVIEHLEACFQKKFNTNKSPNVMNIFHELFTERTFISMQGAVFYAMCSTHR